MTTSAREVAMEIATQVQFQLTTQATWEQPHKLFNKILKIQMKNQLVKI